MSKMHGGIYHKDVVAVLRMFGVQSVRQIKAKLFLEGIDLDETQILEALESSIKMGKARRADVPGHFKI